MNILNRIIFNVHEGQLYKDSKNSLKKQLTGKKSIFPALSGQNILYLNGP